MNPKWQISIETTAINIALGKCLIGNGGRYLHGIDQFPQSFTSIFLWKHPGITGLICNQRDTFAIGQLRPNQLEYYKK